MLLQTTVIYFYGKAAYKYLFTTQQIWEQPFHQTALVGEMGSRAHFICFAGEPGPLDVPVIMPANTSPGKRVAGSLS